MFSKRSIERLAGALLVASFVAFLGHVVTLQAALTHREAGGPPSGPTSIFQGAGMRALPSEHPTTILFVLIYGFLIILSAMTLYLTFRPHERTLALFGAFGLAAHGLFAVLTCILILAALAFAQQFAATSGAETDAVMAAARALELTMDRIRTSTFIFLGFGLVPLGVLIAWSGAVARWVGWLGVVGGIVGFLGLLARLFNVVVGGPPSILVNVAALTMFGFILILGVRLVVWETREATAGKPQRGD